MERNLPLLLFVLLAVSLCFNVPLANASRGTYIRLPRWGWVLEIGGVDLAIEYKELQKNGEKASLLGKNPTTGMIISVFLEKAPFKGDSKQCRDYYWVRIKDDPLKEDVKLTERGDIAIVEYMIKGYEGLTLNQKHMNAYFIKDDICIDVHMSKVFYRDRDKRLFEDILSNIRINHNFRKQIGTVSYSLPDEVILELTAPKAWINLMKPAQNGRPSTIEFSSEDRGIFAVLVTPILSDGKQIIEISANDLKRAVEKEGMKFLARSVERELEIKELKGENVQGYYYTLEDESPEPDGFRYMSQGQCTVQGGLLVFTILTNSKDSREASDAIKVVSTAKLNRK